ncbi:glycosyltransferase family A protein [Chitinasiproducens palmae]|uniref:Glycosyl transferase family 2 n=1 Tax=Chitinasiproducens palmae TaxID=1770053 RepID=A0A1H2PPD5_9BURK|nr:glycosyltransferase family A protein [Chitinasiproducens palmae]SDV48612.1 Glycosyl transferase family 2 [Chitinasiproducens palmae]
MIEKHVRSIKRIMRPLKKLARSLSANSKVFAYATANRISKRRPYRDGSSQPLIISLTTYNRRLQRVHLAIESIFHQNYRNFEIELHLSDSDISSHDQLPRHLKRLEARGLRIFIHPENLRSYKKYYYTLSSHPEATLVTADDDIFYPRDWLRKLVETHKRHPDTVVCYRGHALGITIDGELAPYSLDGHSTHETFQIPAWSLMPTGVSGVLYPPGSLNRNIALDAANFMRLAPTADDIWLKISSVAAGKKSVRVGKNNVHFTGIPNDDFEGLVTTNVKNGGNNRQLEACLKEFPDIRALIANAEQ